MGFVFHCISNVTEVLHITQPARALKFFNFVCSIEEGSKETRRPLNDNETDREIISFYVHYHYLLFQNDTTGSNALIGAWQKKLGHQHIWVDFNLEYERGPPPKSGIERTRSRPARVATRKSTGSIPAPKPKKINPLPRRRSEEYHSLFDSDSLTPLQSSDDEDTPLRITTTRPQRSSSPPSESTLSHPTGDFLSGDPRDRSIGIIDQVMSRCHTPLDENMDPEDGPPPTPPQDISVSINSFPSEPADYTASFTEIIHGNVDDPMNGTFFSAMCLRSGRELLEPVNKPKDTKSLSAPVARSSSVAHRKRRGRTNWYPKKASSKRKKASHVEEAADQPMVIDTFADDELEPEPEPPTIEPVRQDSLLSEPFIPRLEPSKPPSLKISIRLPVSTPPIVQESRVPLSTSCTNIPLPRPAQVSNPDLPPGGLKGLSDTSVVIAPVFPRPTLPSNPPIWAQVRITRGSGNTSSNGRLVTPGALRIL